ncbi:hypothetical protein MIR68_001262 [Amoeboaphelidium protococcarum]|nr:hypothetical protein MIR68_001262 [Amoeboaphelidium protococcarum]
MQQKVWRVCIVGSGPAGFYTASRLLKQSASSAALKSKNVHLEVDMLEGLPVPYGLVRYGISPDHPEVKSVVNKFNEMAIQEGTGPGGSGRFEFMGNVRIRTSSQSSTQTSSPVRATRQSQQADSQWANSGVRVQDLLKRYHSVVLAYGSSKDRRLNIENEDAGGVISARQFVAWYNGYPSQIATVKSDEVIDKNSQQSNISPDCASNGKSTDSMQSNKEHVMMSNLLKQNSSAVIIGQGNVALDIARVLLIPNPRESLGKTDMPDYAVNALVDSKVRDVTIVGRRGPLNVSFTAKELRELDGLCKEHGIQCQVLDADVSEQLEKLKRQQSSSKSKQERGRIRVLELLNRFQNSDKNVDGNSGSSGRSLTFRFFKSPVEINVSKDKQSNAEVISEVKFATTRYTNEQVCDQVELVPDCPAEGIKTNFFIKSIGYQSVGVDGLPFDSKRGILPHTQGRVLSSTVPDDQPDNSGNVMNGVYVAGWLKTGPTGVIASTMYDAYQTADCLLQDIESDIHLPNDQVPARQDTIQWLQSQIGSRPVTFEDWKIIEDEEIRRGKLLGKPYEKITKTDEILQILHKHHNKVQD